MIDILNPPTTEDLYSAVVLDQGFDDPPLRLFPGMRWPHLAVLAAVAFGLGVVVWNVAGGAK